MTLSSPARGCLGLRAVSLRHRDARPSVQPLRCARTLATCVGLLNPRRNTFLLAQFGCRGVGKVDTTTVAHAAGINFRRHTDRDMRFGSYCDLATGRAAILHRYWAGSAGQKTILRQCFPQRPRKDVVHCVAVFRQPRGGLVDPARRHYTTTGRKRLSSACAAGNLAWDALHAASQWRLAFGVHPDFISGFSNLLENLTSRRSDVFAGI